MYEPRELFHFMLGCIKDLGAENGLKLPQAFGRWFASLYFDNPQNFVFSDGSGDGKVDLFFQSSNGNEVDHCILNTKFTQNYNALAAVRSGWMIVGFNLAFDLSRLSRGWRRSRKGGFRLILSLQFDHKSRTWIPHPYRPELSLDAKDARSTFITRGVPRFRKDEWPNPGRFLDVGTLLFSLFDKHASLDQWCAEFQRKGYVIDRKLAHEPSGRVTREELRYCRQDVKITQQLLNAAKREFDIHPLPSLLPDKAYSPASLAKAYMREMNIIEPLTKFKSSR